MPEVDDYFNEVNVNEWNYDGFLKFLTTEKCSEKIWINCLKAISKNNKYADHILDINRLSNLLQKNETQFLRNLFPPANILNAENIFKEVEQKWKLVNLGIETLKERQITFIFDTVQKL
ncbi:25956_t:CDS:2 [Dentiscutata erythropus]|uniref:25956_t:CDS:1 n=1 Tax=Dentiscutata erythropus TaxID=1348616 RepID=A0A9N9A8A1_9GLOM|nr:25956_t:CDS:2 [Dentiscutata erythropus]